MDHFCHGWLLTLPLPCPFSGSGQKDRPKGFPKPESSSSPDPLRHQIGGIPGGAASTMEKCGLIDTGCADTPGMASRLGVTRVRQGSAVRPIPTVSSATDTDHRTRCARTADRLMGLTMLREIEPGVPGCGSPAVHACAAETRGARTSRWRQPIPWAGADRCGPARVSDPAEPVPAQ